MTESMLDPGTATARLRPARDFPLGHPEDCEGACREFRSPGLEAFVAVRFGDASGFTCRGAESSRIAGHGDRCSRDAVPNLVRSPTAVARTAG
jgi:hypothetical protein